MFVYFLAPTGVPKNLTVDPRSVIIQWEEPVCIDRNSEITGYVLQYGEVSSVEMEEQLIQGTGDEGGMYTINGLAPLHTYSIGIAAFSDSGTGPFTWTTIETPLYGEFTPCHMVRSNYMYVCSKAW